MSRNPENINPFVPRVLVGEGKSTESYLIIDGQQRTLSLLILNGWRIRISDVEYTQPLTSWLQPLNEVARC
jgi:uncharacterized protein with ParB-like and HNH nuclease domain